MAKESTLAQVCPGCNQAIYYAEYHIQHCDKAKVGKFGQKQRQKKKKR